MSTHRSLVKSAGLIALFTTVSRFLGFVRDVVIARLFGTGLLADAFVVAFRIPNLLRDLVGEGAANAAFVPVLTEYHAKEPRQYWSLANTLFWWMTFVLMTLSVGGVLFAPLIVRLIAPGFVDAVDPQKFGLTVQLTRFMFPYIFLIGMTALGIGILHSFRAFGIPALGPCLLNISMIVSAIWLTPAFGVFALAIGVMVGGVLQLLVHIPLILKMGFRFEKIRFTHPAAGKIVKLLIPRAAGSAVYQLNVFVDTILASFERIVGTGGQSALYYANRLFQLPLAIVAISFAQAVLPTFSTQAVLSDTEGFKKTLSFALRSLGLLLIPASVGLVLLAQPIIRIIFEHGKFNAYSTSVTAGALVFYSLGLLFCGGIKILVNAFYAIQDTRTPVKTAALCVGMNILMSLVLMRILKVSGLALSSTLSATLNFCLLYTLLRRRLGPLDEKALVPFFLKVLLASMGMGLFIYFGLVTWLKTLSSSSHFWQMSGLAFGILVSAVGYVLLAHLLQIKEIGQIFSKIFKSS